MYEFLGTGLWADHSAKRYGVLSARVVAMTDFWKRSRITKALADGARVGSFAEAETRLDAVRVAVVARRRPDEYARRTSGGTDRGSDGPEMFRPGHLIIEGDARLSLHCPSEKLCAKRRGYSARGHGAYTAKNHTYHHHRGCRLRERLDDPLLVGPLAGGTRTADNAEEGQSQPCPRRRLRVGRRDASDLRLRADGKNSAAARHNRKFLGTLERSRVGATGPITFDVPDKLWFLGLGHLGQGFVWNLCLLGVRGGRAVAQDDQTVGDENEATSLLVLPSDLRTKTRVAARWLEACDWKTNVIERRHQGDIQVTQDDPPYLLCGLDRLQPRLTMARHGFEFMIDAGLGHGAHDFEGIQIRTIAKGQSIAGLWNEKPQPQADSPLMDKEAYRDLEKRIGRCGIVSFAEASTAVPYVGAAAGALVIAQAIRLASLQPNPCFMQIELASPELVTKAGLIDGPSMNLGSIALGG